MDIYCPDPDYLDSVWDTGEADDPNGPFGTEEGDTGGDGNNPS